MRKCLMVIVLSLLTGPVFAKDLSKSDFSPAAVDATRAAIQKGFELAHSGNPSGAAAAYKQAIESAEFANLPDDMRYQTLLDGGKVVDELGDHAQAHAWLVRASESPQASSPAWQARLAAAFVMEDFRDSAFCIATIAQRWPDTLDDVGSVMIHLTDMHLAVDQTLAAPRQALLQSLSDAGWNDEADYPSPMWADLTRMLLAEDKVEQATAVAMRIRSARAILDMRVDKRFDRITQAHPEQFDVARAAEEQLAAARTRADTLPDRLHPQVLVMSLLLDTLRYDEALALGDSIIARVKDQDGTTLYRDFDDKYPWILDLRERALAHLRRWDDAVKQLSAAAARPEAGGTNVSQVLNLGMFYARLKRPEDALRAVSKLGPMSEYGRMQLEMVQLLAAIETKDAAAEATHLAFMRAHRADAIDTWQEALLLDGDMDGAADLLVERLQNEEWRTEALASLQYYHDLNLPPLDVELVERRHQLLTRPKVAAALDQVGRVEHFELQSP